MSNRSNIVMAAVTLGALALGTAALIGAFVVVDDRAVQILQSGPRMVPAEKKAAPPVHSSRTAAQSGGASASAPRSPRQGQTVGSAASARTAGPLTASGETAPDKRRTEARHGSRRHARHMARSSPEQPDSGAATSAAQGSPGSGQSALFFPFR